MFVPKSALSSPETWHARDTELLLQAAPRVPAVLAQAGDTVARGASSTAPPNPGKPPETWQ